MIVLLSAVSMVAVAQEEAADSLADMLAVVGEPARAPLLPEDVDAEAYRIGKKLRCPVCQSMPIADSPSQLALDMYALTRAAVAAGYNEEQIRAYFVDKYDEFVLLDPERRGMHWFVWLAPAVGFAGGLVWLGATVSQWRREPDEVPLPSDTGAIAKDPWEERLLREMEGD